MTTGDKPKEIVLDANVIINFTLTNSFHLSLQLPDTRFIVARYVYESEIKDVYSKRLLRNAVRESLIEVVDVNLIDILKADLVIKHFRKPAGEVPSIIIACSRNAILATDDKKARKVAKDLKLNIIGTIEILNMMIEAKLLNLAGAIELIKKMQLKSAYYPPLQWRSKLRE